MTGRRPPAPARPALKVVERSLPGRWRCAGSRRVWQRPAEAAPGTKLSKLTPAAEDAEAAWRQEGQVRPPMGRDPNELPKSMMDQLPDWVGYGFLYFISVAPVLIAAGAITVLFLNSLR